MIQHNTHSNIMIDQATHLRNLVHQDTSGGAGLAPEGPRVVLMVGGRASVGTTTVARLLGHSLCEKGWKAKVVEPGNDAPENAGEKGDARPLEYGIFPIYTPRPRTGSLLKHGLPGGVTS